MMQKITSSKIQKNRKKLQPRPETLRTIMAFAAAYHVEQLADNQLLQFILN